MAVSLEPSPESVAGASATRRCDVLVEADPVTSNRVMDNVLSEFRARAVIQERLGRVPLPDFMAGDARVLSPRFWNLNSVFRQGDALMRCSPRRRGELPAELVLHSSVACRDVKFQCDFVYSCFRGQVGLSFERVVMNVLMTLQEGLPNIQSLHVENIGNFEVVSLLGVPAVLKWLATKVIKKVIRENTQVIAKLASQEVKEVLQDAVSDQDMGSALLDVLPVSFATCSSSGKLLLKPELGAASSWDGGRGGTLESSDKEVSTDDGAEENCTSVSGK
ncbi:uncharacterized protein LOC144160187 [Haemaphysalis longicornis]